MLLSPSLSPRFLLLCAALTGLTLTACNDTDTAPVFFDLDYQVACLRPGCNAGFNNEPRLVMAIDGDDGYQNSCSSSLRDGARLVSLRSRRGENQAFEITDALIGVDGNVGSSCRVSITEGANTYEGRCSTASPTRDIPCQLTNFAVDSGGYLVGKLYCDNIQVGAAPAITRDIAKSGFQSCVIDGVTRSPCPAPFLIGPCKGL